MFAVTLIFPQALPPSSCFLPTPEVGALPLSFGGGDFGSALTP